MCFSADASLVAGVLLLPAGAYCVAVARKNNITALPLALTPLLFSVQQFCEAAVWIGLERDHPNLVKVAALGFLFFAIAFWPSWIPFTAAVIEPRRERRRLLFALAATGLALGGGIYLQGAFHYDDWLMVHIVGHSIQYDMTQLPVAQAVSGMVWQVLYLGLVCVPLLISRVPRLRTLGITVAIAAIITHVIFRYAFISTWCFFAAFLSLHICYVMYRLPKSDGVRQ